MSLFTFVNRKLRELTAGKFSEKVIYRYLYETEFQYYETPIEKLSSLDAHSLAKTLKNKDDLRSLSDSYFLKGVGNYIPYCRNYYRALSQLLKHRLICFQGDYRSFSIAHYYLILEHIFAPGEYYQQMRELESIFTINHSIIIALRIDNISKSKRIMDSRFPWSPQITEIIKGLEYIAKLYSLDMNLGAGSSFKRLLRNLDHLEEDEVEALWQFRCGLVHSGTLYSRVSKQKVYKFRVDIDLNNSKAIYRTSSSAEFVEGVKYFVNLCQFESLIDNARLMVFCHLHNSPEKYAFNNKFHEWLQTNWSLSYLPRKDEISKLYRYEGILGNSNNETAMDGKLVVKKKSICEVYKAIKANSNSWHHRATSNTSR